MPDNSTSISLVIQDATGLSIYNSSRHSSSVFGLKFWTFDDRFRITIRFHVVALPILYPAVTVYPVGYGSTQFVAV